MSGGAVHAVPDPLLVSTAGLHARLCCPSSFGYIICAPNLIAGFPRALDVGMAAEAGAALRPPVPAVAEIYLEVITDNVLNAHQAKVIPHSKNISNMSVGQFGIQRSECTLRRSIRPRGCVLTR